MPTTFLAALIGFAMAIGAVPHAQAATPGEACRQQAAIAEQAAGIPDGLLLAIGKRESGARDAETGATLPWPWAINRDGAGRYLGSTAEAVATVRGAQAEGAHSIDVGCFQISLLYHPTAFTSLEEAFDPAANAAYAARFLSQLHATTGSWEAAVAAYHSADPARGTPYRDSVLAAWHGIGPLPFGRGPVAPTPSHEPLLIHGVRVWTPDSVSATRIATRFGRMPMVVTPTTRRL